VEHGLDEAELSVAHVDKLGTRCNSESLSNSLSLQSFQDGGCVNFAATVGTSHEQR
jgi:hypothetical protein